MDVRRDRGAGLPSCSLRRRVGPQFPRPASLARSSGRGSTGPGPPGGSAKGSLLRETIERPLGDLEVLRDLLNGEDLLRHALLFLRGYGPANPKKIVWRLVVVSQATPLVSSGEGF